jgi:hypothetical protein
MIPEMPAETTGTQRLGDSLDLRSVIDTIPALVVCALPNGPLFFRWLQGHALLEKEFAELIFEK